MWENNIHQWLSLGFAKKGKGTKKGNGEDLQWTTLLDACSDTELRPLFKVDGVLDSCSNRKFGSLLKYM